MAHCDEGYLCEVCGQPVDEITDSDLYLRFILGQVQADQLTRIPERHLRCNPVQAQFIVDPDFEPVTVDGLFDKHSIDAQERARQEERITRAWRRLQEVSGAGLPIDEYPL